MYPINSHKTGADKRQDRQMRSAPISYLWLFTRPKDQKYSRVAKSGCTRAHHIHTFKIQLDGLLERVEVCTYVRGITRNIIFPENCMQFFGTHIGHMRMSFVFCGFCVVSTAGV